MLSDSLHFRTHNPENENQPDGTVLLYMIPGNPGLIEYYRHFLSSLKGLLCSTAGCAQIDIEGNSLAGFEVKSTTPCLLQETSPYNLQQQIDHVQSQVCDAVRGIRSRDSDLGMLLPRKTPVILIGHSIGSYILLEIVARQQAKQESQDRNTNDIDGECTIIGGICLFPTIVDIAKSPNGKKAAVSLIYTVHLLASPFTNILLAVYKTPRICALSALRCECSLFHYPSCSVGVHRQENHRHASRRGDGDDCFHSEPEWSQAIAVRHISPLCFEFAEYIRHLGKYELDQVTDDKWDERVWGSTPNTASTGAPELSDKAKDKPLLYFFWGENDHWVDNRSRDKLIAGRARRSSEQQDLFKPHMEVDTLGLPHAFCIREYSCL